MSAFLSSFATYFVKMIILAAIALLGAFIGISLRKRSNSKEEQEQLSSDSSEK